MPELVRREPWLFGLTAIAAVAYSTFSVLRHWQFGSLAYDLGIFDQAIWHYSRFELPETTIVGLPTFLGDHLHPILVLLVPLYWIWADPAMLLVAQGILIASSIVPVFLFCESRLGRLPAYFLAGAYSLFWAVHSAIAFDFHEVAFAPLFIAMAIRAIDLQRWRRFFVLVVLLLLVKENMAVLVAFLGLYLVALRHYRQGAITIAAGAAWFVVATKVLIPLFAGGRAFRHWTYAEFGADLFEAVGNIVSDPGHAVRVFFGSDVKVATLFWLFAPFLGLIFLSPLAILFVPLLAERMLSSNPYHWGTGAHYSLTIAPIVVMAAADGLARGLRRLRSTDRRRALAVGVSAAILVVNVPIAAQSDLSSLARPSFYERSAADAAAERAIAVVPPGASVAAQSRFVPHLSQRDDIVQLTPYTRDADYVVADAGEYFRGAFPGAGYVDRTFLALERGASYQTVFAEGDMVVLERRSLAGTAPPEASG
jgi:uncharacterized membrane protein